MEDQIESYRGSKAVLPDGHNNLLLHSCCAPCGVEILERLKFSEIPTTVIFYNPNIHPLEEYELRKEENKRNCDALKIPFEDLDYDTSNWFDRIKGLEQEPERGERCSVCFEMRFERSALYAIEHGFTLLSSTLGISRWKDFEQINRSGERAVSKHKKLEYWTLNWRKNGGSQRMIEFSKREKFYQQEYCGCVYSLRDTNRWRKSTGRSIIRRGLKFYGTSTD
jgi:epoxyqueuosine reductase